MTIRDEIRLQWRTGGAVKRLLFINIGVFLVVQVIAFIGRLTGHTELAELLLWQLRGSDVPVEMLHRPWTVITYMFTHADPMHILWNMLMFWFSGQLFQGLLGERRLVGNYLLGGIAGFAVYFFGGFLPADVNPGAGGQILGASAAVMSVFIGIATYQPEMEVGLMFAGQVKLKWLALAMLVLDLIGIRQGSNTGGHLAHIGGALYGFLAARQLKQGSDWSLGFVNGLSRLGGVFRLPGSSGMRVAKRMDQRRRVLVDEDYNAARKAKQERVDAILDKISRSGYDSLSKEEREFLFKASKE